MRRGFPRFTAMKYTREAMKERNRGGNRRAGGWIAAGFLLAGCSSGTPEPPAQPSAPAGPLHLAVRAEAIGGDVASPIGRCDVVHNDERLVLYLRADRPAHAYVLYLAATGEAVQLFPEPGEDGRLRPDVETPLPTFTWVDPPGEENIYVIASASPLVGADRALADFLSSLRAAGAVRYRTATLACDLPLQGGAAAPPASPPAAPPASPPAVPPTSRPTAPPAAPHAEASLRSATAEPTMSRMKDRSLFPLVARGLVRSHDERTKASHIDGDAGGIAIHHLPFRHLPR